MARYRVRAQNWSRQRTLTFIRVVTLILTGHKHALQNALNRFFRAVGLLPEVPTASAYSQARQKLQPALFQHLNNLVVEKFYTLFAPAGGVKRWQGRRVIGIDGTMINLPDTAATQEHYTVHRNQHAGGERVLAPENLRKAWHQLKANQGAPGADGITIEDFPAFAREHW